MNHPTRCKFCGRPIVLSIDDDYAQIGDYMRLIPKAACNHCSDLREEKRRYDSKVSTACNWLKNLPVSKRAKLEAKIKTRMDALTKEYALFVSKWYGNDGIWWDERFPQMLMAAPDNWPAAITDYWNYYRQQNPPRLPL